MVDARAQALHHLKTLLAKPPVPPIGEFDGSTAPATLRPWRASALQALDSALGPQSPLAIQLRGISFSEDVHISGGYGSAEPPYYEHRYTAEAFRRGLEAAQETIAQAILYLEGDTDSPQPSADIEALLRRFHVASRSLRERRKDREPFTIADEFDVQDALNFLLRSIYETVRRETSTPQDGGGSRRIDLTIPSARAIVEAKFWHERYTAAQLMDELRADVESYATAPDLDTLYCFVYDPAGCCRDAQDFERAIAGIREQRGVKFEVVAIVCPSGH